VTPPIFRKPPVAQSLVAVSTGVKIRRRFTRRFVGDEADAGANRRGLWRGCFVAPQDLRRWDKTKAKLLGVPCPSGDDTTARNGLFPDHPSMPSGCSIKGTYALRAKITGHRGIYHMEGCRRYDYTAAVVDLGRDAQGPRPILAGHRIDRVRDQV
jgi:hypothetical protein